MLAKILKIPSVDFIINKISYDRFSAHYNQVVQRYNRFVARHNLKLEVLNGLAPKKEKKQRLTDSHDELYYELIRQYNKQIIEHCQKFGYKYEFCQVTIDTIPTLKTNNGQLQLIKNSKISKTTVWRRMSRLIEAGVISKINHGPERDYEIVFHPKVIFMADKSNFQDFFLPRWVSLDEVLRQFYGKIANCTPFSNNKKDTLNNKLSLVKRVNFQNIVQNTEPQQVNSIATQQVINNIADVLKINGTNAVSETDTLKDTFLKDTQQSKNKENSNSNNPNAYFNNIQQKENNIKTLRQAAAGWLLSFYLHFLAKYTATGSSFEATNPVVKKRTLEKIEENFFSNCMTYADINKIKIKYQWCIKKAEEIVIWKRHKKEKGFIQYGNAYFDEKNYSGGFIGLFHKYDVWNGKQREKLVKDREKQIKKQVEYKYQEIMTEFYLKRRTFKQTEIFIKKNLPQKHEDFLREIAITGGICTSIKEGSWYA